MSSTCQLNIAAPNQMSEASETDRVIYSIRIKGSKISY